MNYLFPALTTLATIVIAWYACSNHKLTKEMRNSEDRHQQQLCDLYQAIVIATLLAPSGSINMQVITIFKNWYTGKTEIFKS